MRANTRRPSTYEQAKAHVSHPKCRTSTVSTAAMAASSRALQRLTVRMIYIKYVLLEPRDIKRLLCGDGCGANLTPLRSALSGETFARFSHSTLSLYALSVAARAPDRAVRMHSTACRRSAWAGAAPVDAPSLSPSPT